MPELLQALYDSEINVSITSFWDDGWTIKIGDEINGFRAEMNFPSLDENITRWLRQEAIALYPNSVFARG